MTVLLIAFSLLLAGCIRSLRFNPDQIKNFCESRVNSKNTEYIWFLASKENTKGTVLVVHGLNTKPSVMNPIISELNRSAFDVLRVTLRGHADRDKNLHSARAEYWLEDVKEAYHAAQHRFPGKPLFALGYSTGAAVVLAFLNYCPNADFKRMVLLAPAVKIKLRSALIQLLTPFRIFNIALPSFADPEHRSYSFTSLRAYHALNVLRDEVQRESSSKQFRETPALVMLSPDDELISYTGTVKWIKSESLFNWEIMPLHPKPRIGGSYKHFILDGESMGRRAWEEMTAKLNFFLDSD
jgi:alpha-beta hydrolase superfamily lysophospholipase